MQSKETMLSLKHQSRSVSKRYQHCRCWNDSNNLTNFFQITIRVERYIFIIRHEEKEWTSLKIRLQNRDRIIKIRFVKRRERIVYYFYRVSNSREPFKANQGAVFPGSTRNVVVDDDDDTLYVRYRAPVCKFAARTCSCVAGTHTRVPVRVETKVLMGDLPWLHAIHT